jgi:hypothetical protein
MNSKKRILGIRVIVVLLIYNCIAAATMQLFGYSHFVDTFRRFGYPDWTRFLLAIIEIAIAVLLISGKTRPYAVGAFSVLAIGAGSSFLHIGLTGTAITAFACFAVLLGALVYLSRVPMDRLGGA